MSVLLNRQKLFAQLATDLMAHILAEGYEFTFGMALRSREEAARLGFPNSNHTRGLAIDLNLFRGDVYLDRTEDHRAIGEWWERQHELCRWGGRFSRPDGNHYSLAHEGVK